MKIDFRGKEVFSRYGEFYSNVLSRSAIFHGTLRELKGPAERRQWFGMPNC